MKKILQITVALMAAGLAYTGNAAEEAKAAKDNITVTLTPGIQYVHVKGDENRFRQDWWMNDKLSGGLEELTIDRPLKGDWTFHAEGRAMFDVRDYAVRLEIVNPNVGFLRAGYVNYRKYSDNSGGYFDFSLVGPAVTNGVQITLPQELAMDIRRYYAEVGLTLPNWPVVVLGYERMQKDGTKSLVEWGSVNEQGAANRTRKIYPSYKDVADIVDIFKVEIDHDIQNVHIGNQFRYEKYDMNTIRLDDGAYTINVPNVASNRTVTAQESYRSDAFMNTFHMESHINDLVYLSMGYLFMDSQGDAGWDVNTYNGNGALLLVGGTPPAIGRDRDQQTEFVFVDQSSHVLNFNGMFGPFFKKTTSFYGGIQAERTEMESEGAAELFEGTQEPNEASEFNSNNEKTWFQERLGVRFTGIPHTTLFAEGKFDQGQNALYEQEVITGTTDLTLSEEVLDRYTDTDTDRREVKVGFNTSPIDRVVLSGNYRHSYRLNRHNNLVDTETLVFTNGTVEAEEQAGYSAFIDRQSFETDEFAVKLAVRPHAKLNLSIKYQNIHSKIHTTFETAGASGRTGDYDANIYTVSATVLPVNRLYVTALFSYQDVSSWAQENGNLAITTYNGDVYSVVVGAGFALDEKTDLRADYSFSDASNKENLGVNGLDYGADYTRHGVTASLTRQIRDNVSATLRYGYYTLDDDSSGGYNNYTAHLFSGSCTIRFLN